MDNVLIAIEKKEDVSGWKYKIIDNSDNTGNIINEISGIQPAIIEKDDKINDTIKLRIVWHDAISTNEEGAQFFREHFAQDFLIGKGNEKYPIIHFLEGTNKSEIKEIIEYFYSDGGLETRNVGIPRFFSIIDSSIWNYLVPLSDYDNKEKDIHFEWVKALGNVLENISTNYQRSVYKLAIANEYADLNARLTGESFLNGAHSGHVSPFIFHSESAISQLITKEFETALGNNNSETCIQRIKKYNWRFLLVDDKSEEFLKDFKEKPSGVTKLSIIKSIFEQLFDGMIIISKKFNDKNPTKINANDNANFIQVEYAENVEDAKRALKDKDKKYDAVLLDYLLDKDGKVEYGYQLLEHIYENIKNAKNEEGKIDFKRVDFKIGPHKKLFFMFISAYSTAVYERLLSEGLNRNEKYWYIGEGACPTNTPELFKYHLLHLMERRLDQTGINDLSEEQIINDVKDIFMPLKESSEDWIKAVRKRAYEKYHKILGYHYDYFILRENDRNSLLVDSFLRDKVHMSAMLEHLLQLVHLTAFGTVRQWPEIWEEYKFFSRTLTNRNLISDITDSIEKYIIELKSA